MKTFEQANLVLMSENERTKKKTRLQLNNAKENLDQQVSGEEVRLQLGGVRDIEQLVLDDLLVLRQLTVVDIVAEFVRENHVQDARIDVRVVEHEFVAQNDLVHAEELRFRLEGYQRDVAFLQNGFWVAGTVRTDELLHIVVNQFTMRCHAPLLFNAGG